MEIHLMDIGGTIHSVCLRGRESEARDRNRRAFKCELFEEEDFALSVPREEALSVWTVDDFFAGLDTADLPEGLELAGEGSERRWSDRPAELEDRPIPLNLLHYTL